jgi:hypothetical protein
VGSSIDSAVKIEKEFECNVLTAVATVTIVQMHKFFELVAWSISGIEVQQHTCYS